MPSGVASIVMVTLLDGGALCWPTAKPARRRPKATAGVELAGDADGVLVAGGALVAGGVPGMAVATGNGFAAAPRGRSIPAAMTADSASTADAFIATPPAWPRRQCLQAPNLPPLPPSRRRKGESAGAQ